jgi:hypothetical protein
MTVNKITILRANLAKYKLQSIAKKKHKLGRQNTVRDIYVTVGKDSNFGYSA